MEINQPRRILFLALERSAQSDHRIATLSLVEDLTGSKPEQSAIVNDSISGITHTWTLKTSYYSASIPIWIDEFTQDPSLVKESSDAAEPLKAADTSTSEDDDHPGIKAWKSDFLSPEAHEVIRAVGAWVLCFPHPTSMNDFVNIEQAIKAIYEVIQNAHDDNYGTEWDGTCLAVALKSGIAPRLGNISEQWGDLGLVEGFEFIDAEATGKNEFGEKQGLERLKEALEATEWEEANNDDFAEFDDGPEDGSDDVDAVNEMERAEFNSELWGLKASLLRSGGVDGEDGNEQAEEESARQVEELGRMMSRLQAVKEAGASMPEAQRKKFAAKAVNDIMKEIG